MADEFQYVKLPDGSYGKFRSDASDAFIRASVIRDFPNAFNSPNPLTKTTGISAAPKPQGAAQSVEDSAQRILNDLRYGTATSGVGSVLKKMGAPGTRSGVSEETGEFMGSVPLGVTRAVKGLSEAPQGGKSWQSVKDFVGGLLQASQMPLSMVTPEETEAGALARKVIPNTSSAAKKLEEVMAAAKDIPIKPEGPTAEAVRGKELASRGGQLPKILRDFVRRTSDPEAEPITYKEARDFYTNARLAMSEYLQTKPNMWRQVTIFKKALGDAIQTAATEAGKGEIYSSGMAEYRRAKALENLALAAAKIGIPLAIGYRLDRAINSLSKP